jgi:hypothetical protein
MMWNVLRKCNAFPSAEPALDETFEPPTLPLQSVESMNNFNENLQCSKFNKQMVRK